MKRTVRRELIDVWVDKNAPYGQERLSVNARVSYPVIGDVRRGHVPGRENIRKRLAEAIGSTEDELFPFLAEGDEKAS